MVMVGERKRNREGKKMMIINESMCEDSQRPVLHHMHKQEVKQQHDCSSAFTLALFQQVAFCL